MTAYRTRWLSDERTELTLFCGSALAYFVALVAPAYRVLGLASGDVYPGWIALLLGPIVLFGGYVSWLANPLLWWAWLALFRRKYRVAAWSSAAALALALTFLFHDHVPVGSSGPFPYTVLYGYYVWLLSISLAAGSALASTVRPTEAGGAGAT